MFKFDNKYAIILISFIVYSVFLALIASCRVKTVREIFPLTEEKIKPQNLKDSILYTYKSKFNNCLISEGKIEGQNVFYWCNADTVYTYLIDKQKVIKYHYPFSETKIQFSLCRSVVANNKFYLFQVGDNMLYEFEFLIGKLNLYKSYNLALKKTTAQEFISFGRKNFFVINDSSFFFSYGIDNIKKNFVDNFSLLEVKKRDDKNVFVKSKMYHNPLRYKKGFEYNPDVELIHLGDNIAFYGFQFYDSLYLTDLTSGKLLRSVVLSKNHNFENYDVDKSLDLAYVKKFLVLEEMNIHFIALNNSLLVVKRLQRESISQKQIFLYYIIDKNLKIKYCDYLDENVNVNFIVPFKNGFAAYDKNLLNFKYYEVE